MTYSPVTRSGSTSAISIIGGMGTLAGASFYDLLCRRLCPRHPDVDMSVLSAVAAPPRLKVAREGLLNVLNDYLVDFINARTPERGLVFVNCFTALAGRRDIAARIGRREWVDFFTDEYVAAQTGVVIIQSEAASQVGLFAPFYQAGAIDVTELSGALARRVYDFIGHAKRGVPAAGAHELGTELERVMGRKKVLLGCSDLHAYQSVLAEYVEVVSPLDYVAAQLERRLEEQI